MKKLLARLVAALVATTSPAFAGGPVVVELFTSQGCSSCPPADAFLRELTDRPDVIALSMHVDYWDYLGWHDTFASTETTARQYAYREASGARVVYTPQVVVQGRDIVSGNQRSAIEAAVRAAAADASDVEIRLVATPEMLHAELTPGASGVGGTVWVMTYDLSESVEIERGENRGKTIVYENVVRSLMRIGHWEGTSLLDVPLPQPGAGEGVAIILQDGVGGPILAAARAEG